MYTRNIETQNNVIKETVDTLPAQQPVIFPDGWEKEPREPVIFSDAWEKFPPQEPLQNKNECCENLEKQPIPQLGTFAALQQANLQWTTFARDPGPYPSAVPGTVYWDNEDRSKTLAVIMEDTGSIVQDVGEETFYRVKADSTITKGQVVMLTGGLGASGGLKAAPATGLTARQAESVLGIATQNIATNAWGIS